MGIQKQKITKTRQWLQFRKKYLKDKKNWEGYYTCSRCFKWFEYIEVDHIEKRSHAPHRIFDESNLRLLCSSCHRIITDGLGGAEPVVNCVNL